MAGYGRLLYPTATLLSINVLNLPFGPCTTHTF